MVPFNLNPALRYQDRAWFKEELNPRNWSIWFPAFGIGAASFEVTPVYEENKERIHAIVRLPRQHRAFAHNLAAMLKRNLTFPEAHQFDDFYVIEKQID